MLPIVLIIAGIGFLFIPTLEVVSVICFIGAFLGMFSDRDRDKAYAEAEAVGYSMEKEKTGDRIFDIVLAILFLLPIIAYIISVI